MLGLHTPQESHINVEDSKDFGILVRMPFCIAFFIFMSKGHDIRAGARVDRVLRTAQVVGHVVDAKNLVLVHTIADECNGVSFFIGKCVLMSVVRNVIIACQQMVLEPWNKFLIPVSSYASRLQDDLTFTQGLFVCSCTHARISECKHRDSPMW